MDWLILELLAGRVWLRYDEIATTIGEPPASVRSTLTNLRDRGLVQALSVGEIQAHTTDAASYWRLTEKGRDELARSSPSTLEEPSRPPIGPPSEPTDGR